MYQLCGTWNAADSRECNGKFQTAQTMWDQLSVSCHAGEYLSAFCFCSGAGLLGAAFRQTSDGAGRCRDFL